MRTIVIGESGPSQQVLKLLRLYDVSGPILHPSNINHRNVSKLHLSECASPFQLTVWCKWANLTFDEHQVLECLQVTSDWCPLRLNEDVSSYRRCVSAGELHRLSRSLAHSWDVAPLWCGLLKYIWFVSPWHFILLHAELRYFLNEGILWGEPASSCRLAWFRISPEWTLIYFFCTRYSPYVIGFECKARLFPACRLYRVKNISSSTLRRSATLESRPTRSSQPHNILRLHHTDILRSCTSTLSRDRVANFNNTQETESWVTTSLTNNGIGRKVFFYSDCVTQNSMVSFKLC